MSRKSRSTQRNRKVNNTHKASSQAWAWVLLAVTVIFIAVVRIRLLNVPLERDEGEFGYMGQLILQGIPPYKIACNMKLPGTYVMYALFMRLFGQTTAGIHLGLLVMNLISTVLVFILARRLLGPLAAVVASASFGLLSVSPSVLGSSAHATQYVVPFALGGILLMLKAADTGKTWTLVLSGLLLGIAYLMKQHAVFFLIFGLCYYIGSQVRRMPISRLAIRAGLFSFSMVIPFAVTCLILYKLGVFDKFWFWTYTYARAYSTEQSLGGALDSFHRETERLLTHTTLMWALGGVGLTALIWGKKARANGVFLISFVVFSLLTVCPGLYFRQHYFVAFLPALSILIAAAVTSGTDVLASKGFYRALPMLVFIALLGHLMMLDKEFLFEATPTRATSIVYGGGVFETMETVGKYIKAHSKSTDKLVVFGSEPEIYFYAERPSGTTFLYTYGLVEIHDYASVMQKKMMREITESKPEYVVISNLPASWTARPRSDHSIFKWAIKYFAENYEAIGVVEFVSKDFTAYVWGDDLKDYTPKAIHYLTIIRRRPST